jgi:hypothetical protein
MSAMQPKPKPTTLRCTGCGTTQDAACDCGVGYVPLLSWIVTRLDEPENKGKSNVVIAKNMGVDEKTIRRARESMPPRQNAEVEKREGADGRLYKASIKPKLTIVAYARSFAKPLVGRNKLLSIGKSSHCYIVRYSRTPSLTVRIFGAFCIILALLYLKTPINFLSKVEPSLPPASLAPTIATTPFDCNDERNLRSQGTTIPTSLIFVNRGTVTVKVYWLDFNGVRVPYGTLAIDQSLSEQTYAAHPWVITDTADKCRANFAGSQRTEITLNYR